MTNPDQPFALVIRTDLTRPPERVPFTPERLYEDVLLDVIENADEQGVEATGRIPTEWGPVNAYVGGMSLLGDLPTNQPALELVRALGYMAPDMRGTVVVVGAADPDGWNVGCPPVLADRFDEVHVLYASLLGRG
jgi:hypothetical protein